MSAIIETYKYKIGVKFDCLQNIGKCLENVQDVSTNMIKIGKLQMLYQEGISGILTSYYNIMSNTTNNSNSDIFKLQESYKKFMISSNILGELDNIYETFEKLTSLNKTKLSETTETPHPNHSNSDFSNSDYSNSDLNNQNLNNQNLNNQSDDPELNEIANLINCIVSNSTKLQEIVNVSSALESITKSQKEYMDQKIKFDMERSKINKCDQCGSHMTVFPESSELKCDSKDCQQVITLYGIVFEDSQFYNQQNTSVKSKKYDPNGHCSKWIDKIQAKEDWIFPEEIVKIIDDLAVQEYTRNGRLRPMINLQCEKVRSWLKKFKFVDQYDHAPLLRKIITSNHGNAVVPPELTPEERQEILIEYSLCMKEFEEVIRDSKILRRLDKNHIRNKFYYPYILWNIINVKFEKDKRRKKLLECIHLQSDGTLIRNDIVWKEICSRRGYRYMATNSNII